VTRGSAAERAGIRTGDRIRAFAGRPVADAARFRLEILAARSPVAMTLDRSGQPDPIDLQVVLPGTPTRIGVVWKEDDAEPGTVLLTQVVYGSAAHHAGLASRDRIYAVGGRPFRDSLELHGLLTSLPGPIELLLERDGRLRTATLEVLPVE
jgi:serine protease DegQ